jgi:serine/threonine protein kinase
MESTYSIDFRSVGCSLVEMLTGYPPHFCSLPVIDWAVGLINGTLLYHPQQLVPGASRHVITILEKCFRRQTKRTVNAANEIADHQIIRPHSWDLLADVVSVNELETIKAKMKTLENEAEMVRTKIEKLRRFGEQFQGISFRFGALEEIATSS